MKILNYINLLILTSFVVNIFQEVSDELDNTDDQTAKCNGSEMVSGRTVETLRYWERSQVLVPIECPVPTGKASSQNHVTHIVDEAQKPQNSEEIVDMKPSDVR
jgi:hypothetical protein